MTDLRTAAQAVIDDFEFMRNAIDEKLWKSIEALRQALDNPEPSVEALIAEAVANEREACAKIAMDFWCDAGADAIRARGNK